MTPEQASEVISQLTQVREILSAMSGFLVGGFFGICLLKWIA